MSCAVLSFAVWRPSSIHTGLTAIISFIISMTSGPKQSGLEAIDTAAMSSLLAAARNFSRKASTSPYVFVYDWKYAIYLSHLHLPDILFFASSICSSMLMTASSEKSPEPLALQKIQPPVPALPSRLGQVVPAFNDILYNFSPNVSLIYAFVVYISILLPSIYDPVYI